MHNLIPRHTPNLSILMDDLRLTPRSMAKMLHVSERSVYRWMAKDHAPRPVMLSLYFISRWGLDATHCVLHNAATMWAGYARSVLDARTLGQDWRIPPVNLERPAANAAVEISHKVVVGGRDGY